MHALKSGQLLIEVVHGFTFVEAGSRIEKLLSELKITIFLLGICPDLTALAQNVEHLGYS